MNDFEFRESRREGWYRLFYKGEEVFPGMYYVWDMFKNQFDTKEEWFEYELTKRGHIWGGFLDIDLDTNLIDYVGCMDKNTTGRS